MRKVLKGQLGDLKFQLNPTSMAHDGGAVWSEITSPGLATPISSYSYGNSEIYSFELWFNKRHQVKCDVAKAYKTLKTYRNSKTKHVFVYGSIAKNVIVQECSFQIDAWDSKLNVTEFRASISLKVV